MDEIWLNTCKDLEVPDDIARKWLKRLQQKMSSLESGRFFHSWDELLLRKKEILNNVDSVIILAVFFQYYEFDVKKNCAEKNCEIFLEFCKETNLNDNNTVKRVLKLLGHESTEHLSGFEDDANFLQDLDLMVLGSNPEEYKKYTNLLRQEYSHLDDANYNQMRLKILVTFLRIPTIYSTQDFQSRFEEKARNNIKREINELRK